MTAAKKRIPAFPPAEKIFRFASMTLATLMLVALFYLAVVLGQPQEPENPSPYPRISRCWRPALP